MFAAMSNYVYTKQILMGVLYETLFENYLPMIAFLIIRAAGPCSRFVLKHRHSILGRKQFILLESKDKYV